MSTIEAPVRRRRAVTDRSTYLSQGSAAVAPAPHRGPSTPPTARPDHLRVVAPAERRRRFSPLAAVILTAALFALLLAVAVAHTVLVEGQVRLDELDQQLVQEQARYQDLRQEVAELEAPTRIVGAAEEQGMVTPDDLVYLQPPAAEPGPSPVPPSADGSAEAREDQAWAAMKPLLGSSSP